MAKLHLFVLRGTSGLSVTSAMVRILILILITSIHMQAQPITDSSFRIFLNSSKDPVLQKVLTDPMKYRCQIIYTEINRDKNNKPSFRDHYFNYDPQLYFNPASIVKMPLAFLALEKLNEMNIQGVDKYTAMQFDSSQRGQRKLFRDSTAQNGLPSIAHFIRRAFLISENDPYNRLYQFVGQQTINRKLHEKGYPGVRITRQFMGFSDEQNRHTNPLRFINDDGLTIYEQPAAYNPDSFDFNRKILMGDGYMNRDDSIIYHPFDFTKHNNISLKDMQMMLQSVLFPSSVPATQRFNLSTSDYKFLYQFLSQYPSETSHPNYDPAIFYDSYVKFFFRGPGKAMPPKVRVFNKVGWAYGFLTDVSYVADFDNKIEYMLSATLYVNEDGILNDGKYEYDEVGYPFLLHIGQKIYQHELRRKRANTPDLSGFLLQYDTRDPSDTRPFIKEVDN